MKNFFERLGHESPLRVGTLQRPLQPLYLPAMSASASVCALCGYSDGLLCGRAGGALQRKGLLKNFNLSQCFFGEHQLAKEPAAKDIAIVESEKTAIIATVYLPDFIWLAAGQLNGLTLEKFKPLAGRRITLSPGFGRR